MRCAVDDGLVIHDYTYKKSRQAYGSYRNTRRNRKKQQLLIRDTPQDAPTLVNGTLSCRRTPPLWVPRPHAGSRNKNNTHQSIFSGDEHESSVVSTLARAVQKKGEEHLTPRSETHGRSTQLQKSVHSRPPTFSIKHRHMSCDLLSFKLEKKANYLPRELALPGKGAR